MHSIRRIGTSAIRRAMTSSFHSSAQSGYKVAVVGAAGGIGQPLSMLLKLDPLVTDLNLFDVVNTPGVGADLSHICTPAKVTGFVGADQMEDALRGADIVVIPAGVPRKPGMTRDDLFNTNASIVKGIAEGCAKACPNAHFLIISNPVNSTVPIFAEVLKRRGVYNPNHLFGVTTLDVVRANTFVADKKSLDPNEVEVYVIGGHAGKTILPLLSQVQDVSFSDEEVAALTHRVQFGGDEVVKAKGGAGSATLSMAYAGARFTSSLMQALSGEEGIVECTFVQSDLTQSPFFSSPVLLGRDGVQEIYDFGELSAYEQQMFDEMMPELCAQVQKGVDFVAKN